MGTEELIAYKETITQKTKKRNARHARNETPQYDIYTKDLLKEEYDKAFSGDEVAVADGVLSEDDTVDDKPPKPTKKVTSATPKPFRKRESNKHDKTVSFKEAKNRVLDTTKKRRGRNH